MKLFQFSLMVFYAVIQQEHLAITAAGAYASTYLPSEDLSSFDRLSDAQDRLMGELGNKIIDILEAMNPPTFPPEYDDLPPVQNFTNSYKDESLSGNLRIYNIIVDGWTETEDATNVVRDELEIRMAVNVKQLVVDGELTYDTDVANEKGTFSVTLTNVIIEGVASLMADPNGNMVVTKVVVPMVSSEELHVLVKPRTTPSSPILKLVQNHIQSDVEKRFMRIAVLQVYNHYPRKSSRPYSIANRTIFEARRFVSQYYDPLKISIPDALSSSSSSGYLSPFYVYGFSNFHLGAINMIVTNNSVDIVVQISINGLYGNFSFSAQKMRYIVAYSIAAINFIGKIKLMADDSERVPIIDPLLGMQMKGCKYHFRNETSVVDSVGEAEDFFCQLIQNQISTSSIRRTIQSEIFNKVDLSPLKEAIIKVYTEDQLLDVSYNGAYD